MIGIYADVLTPLDDIAEELIKQYGPISPVFEYLGKVKGAWRAVPATRLMVVKPCCSRLDLYKEHAGIDLHDIFPADEAKHDKAKIATWTWDHGRYQGQHQHQL